MMCLDAKAYFLTLVLFGSLLGSSSVCWGAPQTDVKPGGIVLNDDKEYFYPRPLVTRTTDFGVGIAQGVFDKDKEKLSLTVFSIGRSHYQENKTAFDYKLLLTSKTFMGLDAGYRWVFPELTTEEPFAEAGFAMLLDPKDQFANFIDYQRYYLQIGGGFDNLFKLRRSLKIEAGARLGSAGSHVYASLTYGLAD